MANVIPKKVKKDLTDDWAARTLKVGLLKSTYVWATGHLLWTDVSGSEVVGTGYTAGGASLAGLASAYVDTENANLDANNTAWTTVTLSGADAPAFAVVYDTATSEIMAIFDLGGTYPVTAGTLTLIWSASGLIKVSS